MKYICLVYLEERTLNALPRNERLSLSDESMAYCDELQKNGQFIAASPLHPVETATTVRVRNDETLVTDGPYAEVKEALGGYFLLECESMDEALDWAARIPGAEHGAVEVRPVYVDPEEVQL